MLTRLIEMVSFILSKSLETEEDDWSILRSELTEQLEGRGFHGHEIDIAFEVANRIRTRVEDGPSVPFFLRTNQIYQFLERIKLTKEARGLLMKLVHEKKITPQQREDIVERAFFLDEPEIGVEIIQYLINHIMSGDLWPGEDSPAMTYLIH